MLKRLFSSFGGRRKSNGQRASRKNIVGYRRRLRHEYLEDRCMLATLTVNLNTDGAVPTNDGNLTFREAIAYVNGTANQETWTHNSESKAL